jgi:hypothetical protein
VRRFPFQWHFGLRFRQRCPAVFDVGWALPWYPILVVGREDAAGLILVLLEGSEEPIAMGVPAARAVWVESPARA